MNFDWLEGVGAIPSDLSSKIFPQPQVNFSHTLINNSAEYLMGAFGRSPSSVSRQLSPLWHFVLWTHASLFSSFPSFYLLDSGSSQALPKFTLPPSLLPEISLKTLSWENCRILNVSQSSACFVSWCSVSQKWFFQSFVSFFNCFSGRVNQVHIAPSWLEMILVLFNFFILKPSLKYFCLNRLPTNLWS